MAFQFTGGLGDFFGSIDLPSLLVFLLIFAVIFAILEKTKLMGESKKNINILLAFVISLLAVIPHFYGYYSQYGVIDIVDVISSALPSVSLVVVAIISMLILIGLFAHDRIYAGLSAPGWIALFSFITIFLIFGSATGKFWPEFNDSMTDLFGQDALSVVIMILVFGIVIAFITRDSSKDSKIGAMEGLGFHLNKLFDKK